MSQTDRRTNGAMNRNDYMEPLPQRCRLDHVFQKFENKIFLNYLVDCEPYGNDQYKINVKDTEKIGGQTKNRSITISTQKSFSQSAQFIKSFVRYT